MNFSAGIAASIYADVRNFKVDLVTINNWLLNSKEETAILKKMFSSHLSSLEFCANSLNSDRVNLQNVTATTNTTVMVALKRQTINVPGYPPQLCEFQAAFTGN